MPKLRTLFNLAILIAGLAFVSHFYAPAMTTIQSMEHTFKQLGRG